MGSGDGTNPMQLQGDDCGGGAADGAGQLSFYLK